MRLKRTRGSLAATITLLALHWNVLSSQELQVGFASTDITPPIGFRMGGGYGEVISTGIHDPLLVKAMVMQQGQESFAIAICDLLSVPEPLSTSIRQSASRKTGIPVEKIIIAATHNHGSPEYWGSLRRLFHQQALRANEGEDPGEPINYQKTLVEKSVFALTQAFQRLEPASLELSIAEQKGLAFNRRFHMRDGSVRFNPGKANPNIIRPAGPTDTDLPFLFVRSKHGPLGSLSIFAMHTATFGGTEFGADFPMHLASHLKNRFGSGFESLFAEGTAGDINHIDVSSSEEQGSQTEPSRIGRELAQTIFKNFPLRKPLRSPSLKTLSTIVHAPIRSLSRTRFEEAKQILSTRSGVAFLARVRAWRDYHQFDLRERYGPRKPLEVQVVRLDHDTALVSLPHEIFVETGISIKAASPFRNTLVMSLANGIDFYIPTRRAFEEGSYEVTTCPLETGCGELLVQAASQLLQELKP